MYIDLSRARSVVECRLSSSAAKTRRGKVSSSYLKLPPASRELDARSNLDADSSDSRYRCR